MLLRCWWCGDWKTCKIERTWHVGKDLQVKNIKTSVFFVWGQKLNASTTVNSWKRLQSHANTNRNASHVKMRMSQNPGRVAKLKTELLEKRWNCAGSLRAACPCFSRSSPWCSILSFVISLYVFCYDSDMLLDLSSNRYIHHWFLEARVARNIRIGERGSTAKLHIWLQQILT